MLRKGIVALMITIMSVGSIQAEDAQKSNRLVEFLRGPNIGRPAQEGVRHKSTRPNATSGGVTHAVVEDAEKQVPEIRQTSSHPEQPQLQRAASPPQPMPVQYAQTAHNYPSPQQVTGDYHDAGWVQPTTQYGSPGPYYFAASEHYSGAAMPMNSGMIYNGPPQRVSAGPMYPAPRPGIPPHVGGTSIVNPAFHPSEMMHAHQYKAMYGPFYHKVDGCWIVTPFGVWSNEKWKLQGTTVDVKYKSHISPFSMFSPPVLR